MHQDLAAELAAIVGADHLLTDPGLLAGYETDWTRRYHGRAALVVRPGSTDEVAATLRACAARGASVVPQGGNTGLVAGAIPSGDVVLSTTRLDGLDPVDETATAVTVGAGATLEAVQAHVAPHALTVGVDLASRGSATIGGMVATDAGGIRVVRYGSMRQQVLGLEAVLADGMIVNGLPALSKDAVGLDLASLLVGSEGTLAVVTRVQLRLVPAWPERATALVAVDSLDAAVAATRHLRSRLPDLEALEFVDPPSLALVTSYAGLAPPFAETYPAYLVVETAARRSTTDELAAALAGLPGLCDAAVADDGPGRRRLWALRERLAEAVSAAGVPHKLDVGLPLDALVTFVEALTPAIASVDPEARVYTYGHLAEGNLHVNVLGPEPDDERIDDSVLGLVLGLGGTISAEHGIGRAKARWLGRARSAEELAVQAAIKRALDPTGLLNPGVLDPVAEKRIGPT